MMPEANTFHVEARELAERARHLISPTDLARNTDGCLLVLTTPRHEYEVAIMADSTALRIIDRGTGEPLFATGWPYLQETEDTSNLAEALSDLQTMVKLLHLEQPPGFLN